MVIGCRQEPREPHGESSQFVLRCFSWFDGGRAGRPDVDFTIARLNAVNLDLLFGGAGDHASGTHIELRAMPGTLDGTGNQRAIGKRTDFVRAGVAEGEPTL